MTRHAGRAVPMLCLECGALFTVGTGEYNRARKQGLNLYCGRKCAGLSRRNKNPPTDAERRAAKSEYDKAYHEKNREKRRVQHAEWFKQWYAQPENRAAMKAYRDANMQRHVEYCRRPEYRAKKHEYDMRRVYGEYAEVVLVAEQVEQAVRTQAGGEVRAEKLLEINNERNRGDREKSDGGKLETSLVGNLE